MIQILRLICASVIARDDDDNNRGTHLRHSLITLFIFSGMGFQTSKM